MSLPDTPRPGFAFLAIIRKLTIGCLPTPLVSRLYYEILVAPETKASRYSVWSVAQAFELGSNVIYFLGLALTWHIKALGNRYTKWSMMIAVWGIWVCVGTYPASRHYGGFVTAHLNYIKPIGKVDGRARYLLIGSVWNVHTIMRFKTLRGLVS